MSISKDSTVEDICNFLKQFIKDENIISKFKEERIKGNEIFYLVNIDFLKLGYKSFNKIILPKLNEIKKNQKDILTFDEEVNEDYSTGQIYNFLKNEMKFDEKLLQNFKNINGEKFKKLDNEKLLGFGLKLGERKKLYKYIQSIKDITITSSTEELCNLLKKKFNLSEEILQNFKDSEINGKDFLDYTEEKNDLEILGVDEDETIKKILDYIKKIKNKSKIKNIEENPNKSEEIYEFNSKNLEDSIDDEEEKLMEEAIFYHYFLIEVMEYITSEEEINKCPFNKIEEFIQLCEDMKIDNVDNCCKINFDQANDIKLKTVTLWGTKEGLLDFYKKKKMSNTINYFEKEDIKNKSGIVLAIKKDKSLAYIIIWPGKMDYNYKKIDEPQKNLLLSLVRMGLSLSDNSIICLNEKQQNEFNFQGINEFNNINSYKTIVGEVKFNTNVEDFFKIDKKIDIEFDSNSIIENIKDIKINGSSVFIYYLTQEEISSELFKNIQCDNLNFNQENIFIDKNFKLNELNLYNFLNKFKYFSKLLENKKYINLNELKKERIKNIKDNYNKTLLKYKEKINNLEYICEICQNNSELLLLEDQFAAPTVKKELNNLYILICKDHYLHIAHSSCIENMKNIEKANCFEKSEREIFILDNNNNSDLKGVFEFLQNILINNDINILNIFIEKNFETFNKNDYSTKDNYIQKINKLNEEINDFINKNEENILENDIIYKKEKENSLNWKKDIINEINKNYNKKTKNIEKWYIYENAQLNDKGQYLFTYREYKRKFPEYIAKLFTFYPYNNEEKFLLKPKNEPNKWKGDYFENYYFSSDINNTILIQKKDDNYEANVIKNKFNGCYDFNEKNKIFICTHEIFEYEQIYIKYLDGNKKGKSKTHIIQISDWGITNKIFLIPFKFKNSENLALFYHKKIITLVNIDDFSILYDLNIEKYLNNYKQELIQFLVYEKFFLIFCFDEKNNIWIFDIYSINADNVKVFNKLENKNHINVSSKNCKFSIFKIKNDIILYYIYIINNKIILGSRKILASSSSFSIESNYNKANLKEELNFTEGNCVLNYFYHAFKKYPSIGAIQYNYYNKKIENKDIYLYSPNLKKINNFKEYFEKLKNKCKKERGLEEESDLNYIFQGIFKNKKIKKKIGLGFLIIKFIEIIPIQIAKIKNSFQAMSNGKEITQDLYEKYLNKKITITEKADFINFGLKNSIFNFYDLPVIVLVFMGVQSIGKSTLSNEIALSFFNVSGMRCTEGIWMSVSLFKGIEQNNKKCNGFCNYCKKNNQCNLLEHNNEVKCICIDCCCGERCSLFTGEANFKKNHNYCKKICFLHKGHEKEINHICQISPYNHGFICVSLDFEGLGTFERTNEQDTDLSMVGAAMGNSIILRVDKTFDKFLMSMMKTWSKGSKYINTTKSLNYFGGNLIFCQKDIPRDNADEVIKDFVKNITESIKIWDEEEKRRNLRELNLKKLPIFGIFSKFINSPTPFFNESEFHSYLRNGLIHSLVKDVLIKKSLPQYRTGCEFMESLKIMLATVDIHDYNVLDSFVIKKLKKYIDENIIKAMEIFGIYSEINDSNSFEEFERNININLEKLKFSNISNNIIQNIEETLNIQIISENAKIIKKEFDNIKVEIEKKSFINFRRNCLSPKKEKESIKLKGVYIKRDTNKKNEKFQKMKSINSSSKNLNIINNKKISLNYQNLKILGIKEFGLLLLIPSEFKEKFTQEDIRKKLFLIWNNIGKNINLSIPERISYFPFFIKKIIERRQNNVKNWLIKLTSSFEKEDINLENYYNNLESLKEKWIICKEKCSSCNYYCTQIIAHPKEHNCGFDHKCHDRCQKCQITNCEYYNNCNHFCIKKAGHEDKTHLCGHNHLCKKPCFRNFLRGCLRICQLEINHEGDCFCKSKHLCNKKCIYENCSEGCEIQCNLEIDHEGDHKCKSEKHKCKINCYLKEKSKGCKNGGICSKELPHIDEHNCGGDHKCIEICELYGESRGCKCECTLFYGHKLNNIPHNCNGEHLCNKKCYYETKSRNCINNKICNLPYNHKGKCSCGEERHLCSEKCSNEKCQNICNLFAEHEEIYHDCKETHNCNKLCKNENCNKICKFELGHEGKCICGECACQSECIYKNKSHNCKKFCTQLFGHKGDHLCEIKEKDHKCNYKCIYNEKTKKNGDVKCFVVFRLIMIHYLIIFVEWIKISIYVPKNVIYWIKVQNKLVEFFVKSQ